MDAYLTLVIWIRFEPVNTSYVRSLIFHLTTRMLYAEYSHPFLFSGDIITLLMLYIVISLGVIVYVLCILMDKKVLLLIIVLSCQDEALLGSYFIFKKC